MQGLDLDSHEGQGTSAASSSHETSSVVDGSQVPFATSVTVSHLCGLPVSVLNFIFLNLIVVILF